MALYVDSFGFVPRRLDVDCAFGAVRTHAEHDAAQEWINARANRDGHVYPPIEYIRKPRSRARFPRPTGSERPSTLYRLPPSHEIRISTCVPDKETQRYGEAGFVAHFLGFLLGYRCQFEDWWVDGKIATKPQVDFHIAREASVGVCIDTAFSVWRRWSNRSRTVMINAAFLHNRAHAYQWDWERFLAEYQVLDALYAVAEREFRIRDGSHKARIERLCKQFGLYWDAEIVDRVVCLRNDLIHEALWGGQVPGTAPNNTFHLPIFLHRFNKRLGLAMLGFSNDYVCSGWASLGQRVFDV